MRLGSALLLCSSSMGATASTARYGALRTPLACTRASAFTTSLRPRQMAVRQAMTTSRSGPPSSAGPTDVVLPTLPTVDVAMPSPELITAAVRTSAMGACMLLACVAVGLAVAMGSTLTTKLTIDVVSGCVAAIAVSPFVALVDGAIARSLANKTPPTRELRQSLVELARTPRLALYRSDFYFTAFVYCSTFLTANVAMTLRASSFLRLALITGANMWSGISKDAFIARSNPARGITTSRAVGRVTLALFCARDVNAIGASFILPRLIAPHVSRLLPELAGPSAAFACQMLSPPICELVNTQVHLLALDVYNRPGRSAADRVGNIARQYPRSLAVRIMRVLVAFSLGGMGNRAMRALLQQAFSVA